MRPIGLFTAQLYLNSTTNHSQHSFHPQCLEFLNIEDVSFYDVLLNINLSARLNLLLFLLFLVAKNHYGFAKTTFFKIRIPHYSESFPNWKKGLNVDKRAKVALNGVWSMTSVSYPDSEKNQINSFGLFDSKCFEGSVWKFDTNEEKGEIVLTKTDCMTWGSSIEWSVNQEQQLVIKIMNNSVVNQSGKDVFILKLTNQTRDSFQLVEKVNLDGVTTEVVYAFRKLE